MKCVRCGYCCVAYLAILPDGRVKESGVECPFLRWSPDGEAVCEIHGTEARIEGECIPWEETPCGRFDQIGEPGAPCRVGAWLRRQGRTGKEFVRN